MSKATFSVAPSRPSVEDFLDDNVQETSNATPHNKLLTRSVSNPSASTQQLDSSIGLLDQDALLKIGNLLDDIKGENKINDQGASSNYHSQQIRVGGADTLMHGRGFGQWSTKQPDGSETDQLLIAQNNQRHMSYKNAKPNANAMHVENDKTVHRSWGSVEGIATKTDDYLIAMREKAAILIQKWYRRAKIRRTAGAAAMKRMMAAKKQEIEARMSYENEEV